MLKKVICIMTIIISVCTLLSCKADIHDEAKKEVLVENNPFRYTGDFVDLSPMNEDLMDNNIFLIGESHGMKENYQIKKEMVKYLKEKINFKYMLTEFSSADTYLYNQYMETGDISIINRMFEQLEGAIGWTKEEYDFVKWVYSFNQTLKEVDRIIFIGSDIVHQFGTAIHVLKEIVSNHDVIKEIQEEIDFIKAFTFISRTHENMNQLTAHLKSILSKIEKNETLFKVSYGEDYIYLHTILIGIIEGLDVAYYSDAVEYWDSMRDRAMYEIFNVFHNHLPEGKFFGQWGVNHTYQKSSALNKWFATYLNEHKGFKNKVITVLLYYERSKTLDIYKGKYSQYSHSNFYPSIGMTKNNYTKKNTLYKLNEKDSLFTKKLEFPIRRYSNALETGVTTDYIQYFIKFENAVPCEPFGEIER